MGYLPVAPRRSTRNGAVLSLVTTQRSTGKSMRVALFITCFNDTLFPHVGIATTRLLERLGHTVAFPEAQTCCGQMHYNTGYEREAIPLVRHFVETFGD